MACLISYRASRFAIAALITALGSAAADATILYGDYSDIPPGSVMYLDVSESSSTNSLPPGLYGAPTVNGNTLDFNPSGFGASTTGLNPSTDAVEGELDFTVMTAAPGSGLSTLVVEEAGDIKLSGTGTSVTSAFASIFVLVEITHVNDVLLANDILYSDAAVFTRDLTQVTPGLPVLWEHSIEIDFEQILADNGFGLSDNVTKANVTVNNTLDAFGEASTNALVVKKDFEVSSTIIPEPSSLALIALGSAAMLRRRR